ncbi:hypothetical protein [Devosia sp.]|uniref:hypothetical protein n=1 Tax=Devosia sp. TaxID=1871048 RepID=UPI001B1F6BE9|nr:hypothetical protein [Devosia sp.]MBO9589452.1 hypothetical protein [Devosia sp.]
MTNKVPGLRPMGDRPPAGRRNSARANVPTADTMRMPGLRPVARPVDTYVQPQAPSSSNDALQLAAALSQINPQLGQIIEQEGARQRKRMEDMAAQRIGGMSVSEARAAVDSGTISEMNNPWYNAAYMRLLGERTAYERQSALATEYETSSDKATMDFSAFVAQAVERDIAQYDGNEFFAGGYVPIMATFDRTGGAKAAQDKADHMAAESQQSVFQSFLGLAQTMQAEGRPNEEIVTAIQSRYQGNMEFLRLDFGAQDAELVRVAEALAQQGNHGLVTAIFSAPRNGPDGQPIGSLMESREFVADATRIMGTAEKEQYSLDQTALFDDRTRFYGLAAHGKLDAAELEAAYQANPALFSEAQFRAVMDENQRVLAKIASDAADNTRTLTLRAEAERSAQELANTDLMALQAGQLPFIQDGKVVNDKGEWEVVTVEKRREAAADLFASRLTEAAQAQQMTPEQALAYMVQGFASNGMEYPKWRDVLAAAPTAATAQNLSGETLPDALAQATDLYMTMYDMAPRLLSRHITDDTTRDFFDAYRIATEYNGSDKGQAIMQAVKVTQDPDYENPMYGQNLKAVLEKAPRWVGGFLGQGQTEVLNQPYVVGEISRLAEFYVRNGLNPDTALNKAEERFKSLNQLVNGSYVFTGSEDLPQHFPQMAEGALEKYVQDFPEEGLEMDDITIAPYENGSGIWVILDMNTGAPVEDRSRRFITLRSLAEMQQARQQALATQIIGTSNAAQQEAQDTPQNLYPVQTPNLLQYERPPN